MPPKRGRPAKKARQQPALQTHAAQTGSGAAHPDDEEEVHPDIDGGHVKSDAAHPGSDDLLDSGSQLHTDLEAALASRAHDNITVMGAEQSREAVNRDLHAAAKQAGGQDTNAGMRPAKKSSGLKRPSISARNSRMMSSGRQQRAFGPAVYDQFADHSERPRARRDLATGNLGFSPTKQQLKKQKAQASLPPVPAPRRSKRAQAPFHGSNEAQPAAAALHADDGPAASLNVHRDYFPDAMVNRYQNEQAASGAEDHACADDQSSGAAPAGRRPTPPDSTLPQKRPGGRPRKVMQSSAESPEHSGLPELSQQQKETGTPASARAQRQLARAQSRNAEATPASGLQNGSVEAETPQHDAEDDVVRDDESRAQRSSARVSNTTRPQVAGIPAKRSTRKHSALVELRNRRNAEDPEDLDEHATEEGLVSAAGTQSGDVGDSNAQAKAINIRPSEMQFADDEPEPDDSIAAEQTQPDLHKRSNHKQKKRMATSPPAQANTAAKRRKAQSDDDDPDYVQGSEGGEENAEERVARPDLLLWGQYVKLSKIYSSAQQLSRKNIGREDQDVAAVVKLCKTAMKCYEGLMSGEADATDPASILIDIDERLEGLCGRNEDFPTNFSDPTKITDIYAHLLPALVKLISKSVSAYHSVDHDQDPQGQISMLHLQIVVDLMSSTLVMERAAGKSYTARPETSLAVVKPVHNDIAVPLREVRRELQTVLTRYAAERRASQIRQQEAEDRALRLEQEERRSRQAAELSRVREKWVGLHRLRMAVETLGGLIPRAKMDHLNMPDPNLDIDANGLVFRRVSVFHPRVGPPPGLLQAARGMVWTEGELRALSEGLREFAGSMVYERLIKTWCPRNRTLNKYNVMEIVAAAENVKEWYQHEMGDAVEDWIRAIPVWSKAHAVGQENEEEGFVDLDQVVGGEDDAGTVPV